MSSLMSTESLMLAMCIITFLAAVLILFNLSTLWAPLVLLVISGLYLGFRAYTMAMLKRNPMAFAASRFAPQQYAQMQQMQQQYAQMPQQMQYPQMQQH